MRVVVVVLVLAGCGRLRFDDVSVTGDGSAQQGDGRLTTYRDIVMDDAPVAYWRFNAASPGHDEVGAFDATFIGTCVPSAGALAGDTDNAMRFDGSTCYATISNAPAFPSKAPFSVEMWVRDTRTDTYQVYFMYETRIGNGPLDGYSVLINDTNGVYVERIVNQAGQVTNDAPITANQWLHIVATYDGANIAMYFDGAQIGPSKSAPDTMAIYAAPGSIGAIYDGASKLNGDLDELAIYDHALTPGQIAKHHDIGINGPTAGN